jgi:hypothetical protein
VTSNEGGRTLGVIARALALVAAVALASCSTRVGMPPAPARTSSMPAASTSTSSGSGQGSAPPGAASVLPRLEPPAIAGVTWRPAGAPVAGSPVTYLAQVDAGAVGLMWIDAPAVRFRLVPGLTVPEGGPALPADNVPATWVTQMLAAFNGGFMLKDAHGGYFYAHQMVRPLVTGMAALEISADGRLRVGAWGRDLALTQQTVAVRQNLHLLVDAYRSRVASTDTARTWGYANGGLWTANRSALGQLADGSLVYAYGHEVRPAAMADAMVRAGARVAMVLDMNRSWPGGFVYQHPTAGVTGQRIQPQEYHLPSVYYARFKKDFIVVLPR